ncbi:MAG TPA: ATP-binding protein [Acidimicrobiales bacterium]|nr:ATP-binding protein [Acidimicrobiales bacterium]
MRSVDLRTAPTDTVALFRDGVHRLIPAAPITLDDLTQLVDDPEGREILSLVGVGDEASVRCEPRLIDDGLGRQRWSITDSRGGVAMVFAVEHVRTSAAADLVAEWLRHPAVSTHLTRLVILAGSADPDALAAVERLADEMRSAAPFVVLVNRHLAGERSLFVARCAAGGTPLDALVSDSSTLASGDGGRTTLIASFAHHLNNLLTPVVGFSGLALAGEGPTTSDIQALSESTVALAELGDRLRAIAGGTLCRPEAVLPGEVVHRAVAPLRRDLPPGVTLRVISEGEDVPVHADAGHLEIAVRELVCNALDSVAENAGGNVEVSVQPEPATAPHGRTDDWVLIEVTDDGPGLSVSALEHAFDPFFTTRHGQRGLGLPVALGLLRQMGATVEVQCPAGRGTVARIHVQRAR